MKILFVHQGFPAQFKHIAPALAANPHNDVVALHLQPRDVLVPGVRTLRYTPGRGNCREAHPWLLDTESKIIRGEAVWHRARALRDQGFSPDLMVVHPGWGEDLFLKEVWPKARLLVYCEFYYHTEGADVGFDPEFPVAEAMRCRLRLKNMTGLLSLEACDAAISPTHWQRSLYPASVRDKITVIHDGIDTDAVRPHPGAGLHIAATGETLTRDDEIITFVNRNLEPYRGFHRFMRALPELLARRPRARVLIVGGEGVGYGAQAETSWKARYLNEVGDSLDKSRVHFVGQLDYPAFVRLLQVSSVHVYLTVPFILSWSMLEAMSAGCLVIGSRTPPVEEVLVDGHNGLLVDFFDPAALAGAMEAVLDHPTRMQPLRDAARDTVVRHYDLKTVCLPQQLRLLDAVAGRVA